MLKVRSDVLELRGISNATSKRGNVYYSLNVEEADGTSHSLYCPKADAFPEGLKKGDKIRVVFDVSYFRGYERLSVSAVERGV